MGRVHVLRGGHPDGAAIVLVHGLGVSSAYFRPLLERLAVAGRLIAPDLPGWGKSYRPLRPLDITSAAVALADVIEAERIRVPAACVGNSLGCQIVIELARRRPELVRALILISPTVDPRYRTPTRQALTLAVDSLREPPGLWRIIWGDYRAMGLRRLLATARFGLRDRPEAKLPGIHMPVLVLRGERDMITTRGWAERCARLAENGRYVPVAKAAHAAHFTDPDEVARLISSFLAEVADHGQ